MKSTTQGPVTRAAMTGGLLTVAVVIAFAPDAFLPMLLRSWLPLWIAGYAAVLCWLLMRHRWAASLTCGIALILLAIQASPSADPVTGKTEGPFIRIAHLNVLQTNAQYNDVLGAIASLDADVLCIQEVNSNWHTVLIGALSDDYPYHRISPRENCYGIALFSRIPFEAAEVINLQRSPAVDALFSLGKGKLRVIAVHATSPQDARAFDRRNAQLDQLAKRVGSASGPCVVIGDLNATPWDRALQRTCAMSRMTSTATISAPTWPAVIGLPLIPIDHLLIPASVELRDHRTFIIPGSDHRGIVADLTLR